MCLDFYIRNWQIYVMYFSLFINIFKVLLQVFSIIYPTLPLKIIRKKNQVPCTCVCNLWCVDVCHPTDVHAPGGFESQTWNLTLTFSPGVHGLRRYALSRHFYTRGGGGVGLYHYQSLISKRKSGILHCLVLLVRKATINETSKFLNAAGFFNGSHKNTSILYRI